MASSGITLQINLSAGDAAYADLTVPALLAAHPLVAERLLVVDLCKPQRTRIVDPAQRFPEPAYTERAQRVSALADRLLADGKVDRVVRLTPGDPLFPTLSRTYLRPWVTETHDYGGCALMSYLAAFELCRTRWLLHYDADILLYQAPGFDWANHARALVANDPSLIAAIPRPSPPAEGADVPSQSERLGMQPHPAGWLMPWYSTRCYLFDCVTLKDLLPLLQGRVYWEALVARLRRQGYPRSPEVMLHRRLSAAGRWRLTLRDQRAWLIHPARKDAAFVAALPALLAHVGQGRCPGPQRGQQDLDLNSWQSLFAAEAVGGNPSGVPGGDARERPPHG